MKTYKVTVAYTDGTTVSLKTMAYDSSLAAQQVADARGVDVSKITVAAQ
jgi:hypothetical protein